MLSTISDVEMGVRKISNQPNSRADLKQSVDGCWPQQQRQKARVIELLWGKPKIF